MVYTPLEALNKAMDERVAKARLVGYRTLANLIEKGRIETQLTTQMNWDADVGGAIAAWEAVTANGSNTAIGDTVPATLTIGAYRLKHQFPISKIAIQEAKSLAPSELSNLFATYLDRGVSVLMRKLNTELFTGDGTATFGGMVGLNKVCDNTVAYAGIDPVTYPVWKALNLTNATPRPLTRGLMLDYDELLGINEGMYDTVITHPTTAKAYVNVFDTIAGGAGLAMVDQPTGLKSTDLGHGGRAFNGIPLVEDYLCPVGAIRTMYSPDVTVKLFELADPTPDPGYAGHVVNRAFGVPIHIAELPSLNSAVRVFELFILPQLKVFNRKSVGGIFNLS